MIHLRLKPAMVDWVGQKNAGEP